MIRRVILAAIAVAMLAVGAVVATTAIAHACPQLDAARDAVCSIGGRSANPFALTGAKMSLEQRFGLTDAQATSLMWRAIDTYCP